MLLSIFHFSGGHTAKPVAGSDSGRGLDEVRVLGCEILLAFSLTIFTLV